MVVKDRLPGEENDHRFRREGGKSYRQFTRAWATAH